MVDQDIKVTVICTTYNHEPYIRQCLDGFVMQKTNFPYEVIVHDDASTDKTAEIIREYKEKYPDLFVPILQSENCLSQHKPIIPSILSLTKGTYIARCEGDDFWTDPLKLQKQYDLLSSNPSLSLCLHNVRCTNEKGEKIDYTHPHNHINSGLIPQKDFIELLSKDFFQLTSYFYKKDVYESYIYNPPVFKTVADVGDVACLLFFAAHSEYIGYIDAEMSCYRGNAVGSWNSRQNSAEKWKQHYLCMSKMYTEYDKYTNYKFHDACLTAISVEEIAFLIKKHDILSIFKNRTLFKLYRELYTRKDRLYQLYQFFKKSMI